MPFKIFVLGAAVFEMKFRDFLAAIFAGRFVRFLSLSLLTLWFGPQIVGVMGVARSAAFFLAAGSASGRSAGVAVDAAESKTQGQQSCAERSKSFVGPSVGKTNLATLGGQPRRLSLHDSLRRFLRGGDVVAG